MTRKSIFAIAAAVILTPPTIGSVMAPPAKVQQTIGVVEAAALPAMASAPAEPLPVATMPIQARGRSKHPCLRHAVPVKAPKRESITDDMEKKYEAALNTAYARSMDTRKCLLEPGQ